MSDSFDASIPLYVDLDGSLLSSDTLFESIAVLLHKSPWQILLLPYWLVSGGKTELKARLAENTQLNYQTLPYNSAVLEFLKHQKIEGRKVILCTAAHRDIAQGVAEYLGIFSDILATEDKNLKGLNKLEAIKSHCGGGKFDYLGDSKSDLPIFKQADSAYVVSNNKRFIQSVDGKIAQIFPKKQLTCHNVFKMLRVHQWLKNALLFFPALMAHQYRNIDVIFWTLCAFVIFCLCCSGVYILNDLIDIENDRKHEDKKGRPFAAGTISIFMGLVLVPILIVSMLLLTLFFMPSDFTFVLAAYLVTTCAYSWYLKQKVALDIVALAGLYTLRILAGGCAGGIYVSPWLLSFSLFMFTSLACVKRYAELRQLDPEESVVACRGYIPDDANVISQIGSACGFISVLVLALYINANTEQQLYARPWLIWLCCPVVMYWVARIWLLAHRGKVDQDPIIFAMRDITSYVVLLISVVVILLAGWTGKT